MNLTPFRAVFGRDSLRSGQVAPWLHAGAALDGPRYLRLRLRGTTHVVDLRDECSDDPEMMDGLGLRWRRLPIPVDEAPSHRQLGDLMRWLEAEADEVPSAVLYLHGATRDGRTATVAVALLMHQEMSQADAEGLVTRALPAVAFTSAQRAFLDGLAARLVQPEMADLSAAGNG